ncbi:AMP-binding enzyme [Oribacterium sp. oral taxon 078 str. F0262]|uniref:class I adenylate-forming enzyme family protein n=1 Tax=Oribacterium sp. oral taxon 078 TaxID=652706 RepID=UPI0001BCB8CE|nr:class I adenylate-forming enzyme family protein [Oribacterium sp. oral taxon 078]EFE92840.1 AMP-binding enzyme [Oribacterium sp. oral taxon 078 str. F0262]
MSEIVRLFDRVCEEKGEESAFFYFRKGELRRKSFRELHREVESRERCLIERGLCPGQRILLFAPPSYELLLFMLAAMRLGISLLYADVQTGLRRGGAALKSAPADAVAVNRGTFFLRLLFPKLLQIPLLLRIDSSEERRGRKVRKGGRAAAKDEISGGRQWREERKSCTASQWSEEKTGILDGGQRREEEESFALLGPAGPSEDTEALLTMTTGSTGSAKTVIRTHGELLRQLRLTMENQGESGGECVLVSSFMYCFSNLLMGNAVALPELHLGIPLWSYWERRLRHFSSLPIRSLMTTPDFCLHFKNAFPGLRELYIGGAILNIREAERILANYPGVRISYIYGATECNLIARTELSDYVRILRERGESCLGGAVSGVSIRIEGGEILVKSDALLRGSLAKGGREEREREGSWHRSGDLGELREGKLYYLGRRDVYLVKKGRRVPSGPLEQRLLLRFPTLSKAACFYSGGKNRLFYEECGGKTEREQIREFLREEGILENTELRRIGRIPRDRKHHSKTDYRALKKRSRFPRLPFSSSWRQQDSNL